jgi:hypothetical protein
MTTRRRGPGRRFTSGNPGRPKGSRNRATQLAEALLDGEAEGLTRKAIELALGGDAAALRLCLERVIAPRRERPLTFTLPALRSAKDTPATMASITEAVAAGAITLGEAAELVKLVETFIKALETHEFEERLRLLESRQIETRP